MAARRNFLRAAFLDWEQGGAPAVLAAAIPQAQRQCGHRVCILRYRQPASRPAGAFDPDRADSMQRRLLTGIAVVFLLAGITAAVAGCIPFDRMQTAGELVRRADDFTPERFARFRHVCWFFALTLPAIACCIWPRRATTTRRDAGQSSIPQAAEADQSESNRLVWVIVAASFILRLLHIDDPVAYDEAYTYLNFASRPWYEAIGDYNSTNNHLLNTLLMHVSTRIFGPQEWALRWHVLLAGGLLPWAVYAWAQDWFGRPPALMTAAAVAVSPALITYSADARGYMLVALAAIILDSSQAKLTRGADARAWWSAWGALVAGLCAMPLMMYPAIASSAWYLLLPVTRRAGRAVLWGRLRTAIGLWALAIPAVGAFYAPAYIFRGLMFLNDPIMQSAAGGNYWTSLWAAWCGAFEWWTDGVISGVIWIALAIIGICVMNGASTRIRWGLPFLTVLTLNVVQHVAPPPRIYLHLAPWFFIAAAIGLIGLLHASRRAELRDGRLAVVLFLTIGSFFAFRPPGPVLFHANERENFVSVPEAIEAVQQTAARHPGERCIVLAPLPCDLPSIFYLRRSGIELPVNARPQPGDHVYLIARPGETPHEVLATPLLDMADLSPQYQDWLRIGEFDTLEVYASRYGRAER